MAWLSPSFPVGSFAYSHGLEAAVEAGDILDADSLHEWLDVVLAHGAGRNDAIVLACAWRAAAAHDLTALMSVNELALAMSPSLERHLETTSQGRAFVEAVNAAWPCPIVARLSAAVPEDIAYPVALGAAAAAYNTPLTATLESSLLAFASNLVSAAIRLGVVGQTDGQRAIAKLIDPARAIARIAESSGLGDIGGFSPRVDMASMRHETLYSRLFRS